MANLELVLFHGPPHVGKTSYYHKHLSKRHKYICPQVLYQEDTSLGLRQVLIRVVNLLKQGHNVVVDDELSSAEQREAYVSFVRRKVPQCSVTCLMFTPSGGLDQLRWARQVHLAQIMLYQGSARSHDQEDTIGRRMKAWCQPGSIDGPDKPSADEDMSVKEVKTNLHIQSHFKFEVPALLIEWSALVQSEEGELVSGVQKAVTMWYKQHLCGRVIIIQGGHGDKKGMTVDRKHETKEVLDKLTKEVTSLPVYIFSLDDPSDCGSFCVPPSPGIISYLMCLHHLDLRNQGTVYLYYTSQHMKMAEHAGIQHLQASRAFKHPSLLKSSHGTTKHSQPEVLQRMTVSPPMGDWINQCDPVLPGFSELVSSKANQCHVNLGQGKSMFAGCGNKEKLKEYQELYYDNATPISEAKSRIDKLSSELNSSVLPSTSRPRNCGSPNVSVLSKERSLPRWMHTQQSSKKKKKLMSESISSLESSSSVERRPGKSTVYMMNVKELLEVAHSVLKQAGIKAPERKADSRLPSRPGKSNMKGKPKRPPPRSPHGRKHYSKHPIMYSSDSSQELKAEEILTDHEDRPKKSSTRRKLIQDRGSGDPDDDGDREDERRGCQEAAAAASPSVHNETMALLDDLFFDDVMSKKKKSPPKRTRFLEDTCPQSVQDALDDLFDRSPVKKSRIPATLVQETQTQHKARTQLPSVVLPETAMDEQTSFRIATRGQHISKPDSQYSDDLFSYNAENSVKYKDGVVLDDSSDEDFGSSKRTKKSTFRNSSRPYRGISGTDTLERDISDRSPRITTKRKTKVNFSDSESSEAEKCHRSPVRSTRRKVKVSPSNKNPFGLSGSDSDSPTNVRKRKPVTSAKNMNTVAETISTVPETMPTQSSKNKASNDTADRTSHLAFLDDLF